MEKTFTMTAREIAAMLVSAGVIAPCDEKRTAAKIADYYRDDEPAAPKDDAALIRAMAENHYPA